MREELRIRHDILPGDIGRIVSLHGEVYDSVEGFGLRFEAFVGQTLAEFVLMHNANGKLWLVERGDKLVGCTAVVLHDDDQGERRGQIRWVVLDPSERGQGLGKKLVTDAVEYCRAQDCRSIFLETTDGLKESQTLYERMGFEVTSNTPEKLWDGTRALIIMNLDIT